MLTSKVTNIIILFMDAMQQLMVRSDICVCTDAMSNKKAAEDKLCQIHFKTKETSFELLTVQ